MVFDIKLYKRDFKINLIKWQEYSFHIYTYLACRTSILFIERCTRFRIFHFTVMRHDNGHQAFHSKQYRRKQSKAM